MFMEFYCIWCKQRKFARVNGNAQEKIESDLNDRPRSGRSNDIVNKNKPK